MGTSASTPSTAATPLRPPCTCCAGPEENWFQPGSCVLHPVISDDQVDALIENPEADPPLSIYAAAAARWGLPVWAMMVPDTTRDMFENDAVKIKRLVRLVRLVSDYLDASDSQRSSIETVAAGLAELNRRGPAVQRALLSSKCEELAHG
jgi:hypothetical protein